MLIRDNASQMATALANKEISAVELTNQHYQQIEAVDKDVHASDNSSVIVEQAQAISAKLASRHPHIELALREVLYILARMGI